MKTVFLSIIVILLLAIAGMLGWILFAPTGHRTAPESNVPAATPSAAKPTTKLAPHVLVDTPAPHATVGKNFTVSGQAPGPWFNEAVFPIKVLDTNGKQIGEGQGQAQGEWMSNQPVAFFAQITTSGYAGPARLMLMKDNPSGDPARDESVTVPIVIQ